MDCRTISKDELLSNTKIPIEILDTEDDIYHDMARVMVETIEENNKNDRNTVFIVPVGPIFQYRRFARLANMKKMNLRKVYLFNMDEYLNDEGRLLEKSHPLSFRGLMDKELYQRLDAACMIPEENRFFPKPDRENEIWEKITELGGTDVAFGGIGIRGHIAFNEPPEEDEPVSDQEFRNLATRVLELNRETRTINAVTSLGGYIDGIPKKCITIGMKEILASRKIRFYLNREWQRGIVRKICLGDVTSDVPASFFQMHGDAKLILASYVAEAPCGRLR